MGSRPGARSFALRKLVSVHTYRTLEMPLQASLCKILKSSHPSSATSSVMGTSLPHETAHFIVEWPKWLESGQLTLGWNLSAWQVLPLVLVHRACLLPLPPCQPFKLLKMAIMGLLSFLFPRLNISVSQLCLMWHSMRTLVILSNPHLVSDCLMKSSPN